MNAKYTIWNSRIINTRGRTLARYADQNEFDIIAPQDHTYFPRNPEHRSDILDIVLVKTKAHINRIDTLVEFNPDQTQFSWKLT